MVPPENTSEEDVATIRYAHGDTVLYSVAKVQMEVDGIPIEVKTTVSVTLPASVPPGEDIPDLQQLMGSNPRSSYLGLEL